MNFNEILYVTVRLKEFMYALQNRVLFTSTHDDRETD